MSRVVRLDPAPDVELLGTAVLIRGAAAVDLYRILGDRIGALRTQDGIAPPPRLLQALAALKEARDALAEQAAADVSDFSDVREVAEVSRSAARSQPAALVGIKEVAAMCGVGERQARRLATSLGGRKVHNRWVFSPSTVVAYLASSSDTDVRT